MGSGSLDLASSFVAMDRNNINSICCGLRGNVNPERDSWMGGAMLRRH